MGEITPDKLTKTFLKIRAKRSLLTAEFKKEDDKLQQQLDRVKQAMHTFIKEHNVPELLDKRINQTNMKDFLEDNPDKVPDGLEISQETSISVRKR